MPDDALEAARTDALATLAALTGESGELVHHWVLRYSTAISPEE